MLSYVFNAVECGRCDIPCKMEHKRFNIEKGAALMSKYQSRKGYTQCPICQKILFDICFIELGTLWMCQDFWHLEKFWMLFKNIMVKDQNLKQEGTLRIPKMGFIWNETHRKKYREYFMS